MNKDGTPRKTISDEAQKARLEVLRKGREKANIKRQLAKEELKKKRIQSTSNFRTSTSQNSKGHKT